MSGGQTYAAVTCIAGVSLLLSWLYVLAGHPRSTVILLKSLALFVVPIAILIAIPERAFQFPLSLWFVALVEEVLKAVAAATERNHVDRFFLVSLFGIWELIWVKPLWGLNHSPLLEGWTNVQLMGLAAGGIVTVIMHGVTAEIYAFRLQGRLLLALALSWVIHTAFNESIEFLGVSWTASMLQLLPLVVLFAALWPKGTRPAA